MDNIIADQKIGKRRRITELRPNSSKALPYRTILQDEAQRIKYRPKKASNALFRSVSPAQYNWRPIHAPIRLRGEFGRGIHSRLRNFAIKLETMPRKKTAKLAAASAAVLLAFGFGIAALVRGPAFPMPRGAFLPAEDSIQDLLLEYVSPELADGNGEAKQDGPSLPPAPVSLEMTTYRVRSGESLASIAKRFGLNIDTIISANGIADSSSVRTGTQLRIPNLDGVIYKVRSGDNLASVAKRFKSDTTKIVDANDLDSSRLMAGQSLIIPGARLPEQAVKRALGQRVAWPVRGPISSYFGYRPDPFTGVRRFHGGIDIVVDANTPVRASMEGRVSDVGYNANYGNYIIMSHADGYQTLYGHLTSSSVSVGMKETQGAVIGLSGNTGYSTGPHLHFSLFKRSLALNPLKYLK
jgi:murein DD-endopeptidase MepM/ murein hydrolase activator NlpD